MKKIILDPGIIPFDSLKHAIVDFKTKGEIIILTETRRKDDWKQAKTFCNLIFYNFLNAEIKQNLASENVEKFSQICEQIINDHRTLLIAERVSKIFAWESIFNCIYKIEKMIYNSVLLIQNESPDLIIFQATPHNLPNWVLAKTFEFYNIPVLMIQTSPLPWKFWLVKGLDIQKHFFPYHNDEIDDEVFDDFINLNSSDYKKALPSYEKKRIENRGGKYWSWKKEIYDGFKKPKIFFGLPFKRRLYISYNNLVKQRDKSKEYLILFLHYQPERTSMPEANFYSQQWLVILMISMLLPNDYELLVKEHPSTFTGKYDVRYRHPDLYSDISKLKNVKLISIEEDTFGLIDNSVAIVTITGTVGVQSLIRNKPVIVFGTASYREFSNYVFFVKDSSDLYIAIEKIREFKSEEIKAEFIKYLKEVKNKAFSGMTGLLVNDIYNPKVRLNGHKRLLIDFFSHL